MWPSGTSTSLKKKRMIQEIAKMHQKSMPSFEEDAEMLLQLHTPTSQIEKERHIIVERVRNNLEKIHSKSNFSLVDMSLHKFGIDLDSAPVELVIHDQTNPNGITPDIDPTTVPSIYTRRLETRKIMDVSGGDKIHVVPSYSTTYSLVHKDKPALRLSSPSPLHDSMTELLLSYTSHLPELPKLLGLVLIWLYSHGLTKFTTRTVHLMLVQHLQLEAKLPSLHNRPFSAELQQVWNWESTEGMADLSPNPRFHPKTYDVHLTGKPTEKIPPKEMRALYLDWLHSITQLKFSGDADRKPAKGPLEAELRGPFLIAGERSPLFVPDLLAPQLNHAVDISGDDIQKLRTVATESFLALRDGLPLISSLGPNLTLPEGRELNFEIEPSLGNFVKLSAPSPAVLKARNSTMKRLNTLVHTKLGKHLKVEPFGSTVYGVDSNSSDLDVVILDPENPEGYYPGLSIDSLPRVYDIDLLKRTVRSNGFTRVAAIPAAVPIVKAVDPRNGFNLDINCNDRLGYVNTGLIKRYTELSPVLRPLLYFIKLWAKSYDLNDPSLGSTKRSFSSYCYALMVIGYLQKIGNLPNLQADIPELLSGQEGRFWSKNKSGNVRTLCDIRYNEAQVGWVQQDVKLAQAVYGWFRFWGTEHDYHRNKLCIRGGGVVPRQTPFKNNKDETTKSPAPLETAHPVHSPSVIESTTNIDQSLGQGEPTKWFPNMLVVPDPFMRKKNVGGNVDNRIVRKLRGECQRASFILGLGEPLSKAVAQGQYRSLFERGAKPKKS